MAWKCILVYKTVARKYLRLEFYETVSMGRAGRHAIEVGNIGGANS